MYNLIIAKLMLVSLSVMTQMSTTGSEEPQKATNSLKGSTTSTSLAINHHAEPATRDFIPQRTRRSPLGSFCLGAVILLVGVLLFWLGGFVLTEPYPGSFEAVAPYNVSTNGSTRLARYWWNEGREGPTLLGSIVALIGFMTACCAVIPCTYAMEVYGEDVYVVTTANATPHAGDIPLAEVPRLPDLLEHLRNPQPTENGDEEMANSAPLPGPSNSAAVGLQSMFTIVDESAAAPQQEQDNEAQGFRGGVHVHGPSLLPLLSPDAPSSIFLSQPTEKGAEEMPNSAQRLPGPSYSSAVGQPMLITIVDETAAAPQQEEDQVVQGIHGGGDVHSHSLLPLPSPDAPSSMFLSLPTPPLTSSSNNPRDLPSSNNDAAPASDNVTLSQEPSKEI